MTRWLGRVLPLDYVVGFVLLCVLAYIGPYCLFAAKGWSSGWTLSGTPWLREEALQSGATMVSFLLRAGAAFYGAYRASVFTPSQGSPYYAALSTLPYDGRTPLLAGPILPVAQDAVLIVAAEIAMALIGRPFGTVLVAFLLPNLAFIAGFLLGWSRNVESYALAVGVIVSFQFVRTPWIAAGLACITAALEWVIVRRFLLDFPWAPVGAELSEERAAALKEDQRVTSAGWPLGVLAPHDPQPGMRAGSALAIGVLFGLAVHSALVVMLIAGTSGTHHDKAMTALGFSWIFLGIASISRIVRYASRYRPPVNFFGRLGTGRLLLPSYDIIFVTPLVAIVSFAVLTSPYFLARIPFQWLLPTALGLFLAILVGGPPSLEEWRCTGGHRMVAPGKDDNNYKR